jgi:multidrug transporter EmrE-like cation transporter
MSRFLIGNLWLGFSMVTAAAGHIIIKKLIDQAGTAELNWEWIRSLMTVEKLLRGGAGAALIIAAFIFWLIALTRLDLSYAYPIACSSVLLVAFFSALFLGEPVTIRTWLATLFILGGIILLMPSRPS